MTNAVKLYPGALNLKIYGLGVYIPETDEIISPV
jgi:hypothetical protein